MKAWLWLIVAPLGVALMFWSYRSRQHADHKGPWSTGLLILSTEAAAQKTTVAEVIPARLRLLSTSEFAELLLFGMGDLAPEKALEVKGQLRAKLIEVSLATAGIGAAELQSGRLPEPGRNEVLSGAAIDPSETLIVGQESLKVVGVLKPDVELLASSFVIPPGEPTGKLFPATVPTVLHAWLVRGSAESLRDASVRKPLEEAFPPAKYAWVSVDERLDPRSYYLYLSGLAIFLLGGSGSLIAGFRWLAGKITSPFLAVPLLEMKARPRLVWSMHLVYFGLVIAGSLLIYAVPEAQVVLLGKVREALVSKGNPLGIAGDAYRSGNIPLAAAVTITVNFLLGSLASITVPSILVPGLGAVFACIRAIAWGLLLAPSMQTLALGMLPHSLTMLLEGEGYILAAIFGLMIPIHVVSRGLGGNLFTRFGRSLLLNLKAQIWIALVLAVAAIYEATEVILMNS